MSLTASPNDILNQQQLAAQNCISLTCPPSSYLTGYIPNVRSLSVEAVEQGYIVEAYWGSKKVKRVALGPEGLAEILSDWAAQYEQKAK